MSEQTRKEEIGMGSIEEESPHTKMIQEAITKLSVNPFGTCKTISDFLEKGLKLQEVIAILIAYGYKREDIGDLISRLQKTNRISIPQGDVQTKLPVLQWIKDLEMATDITYNNAKGRAAMAIAIGSSRAEFLCDKIFPLDEMERKVTPDTNLVHRIDWMLKIAVSAGWDERFLQRVAKVLYSEIWEDQPHLKKGDLESWVFERLGYYQMNCIKEEKAQREDNRRVLGLALKASQERDRRTAAALLWYQVLCMEQEEPKQKKRLKLVRASLTTPKEGSTTRQGNFRALS